MRTGYLLFIVCLNLILVDPAKAGQDGLQRRIEALEKEMLELRQEDERTKNWKVDLNLLV